MSDRRHKLFRCLMGCGCVVWDRKAHARTIHPDSILVRALNLLMGAEEGSGKFTDRWYDAQRVLDRELQEAYGSTKDYL